MDLEEYDPAQAVCGRMAELTNTDARDWFLVTKARQGMQVVLDVARTATGRTEVATQLFTCVTAVNPILAAGLTPRYVDIDENTLMVDPALLEVDDKTCAVVLQRTFGLVDESTSNALREAAHHAGALLLEDAAHCVGNMARNASGAPVADVSVHSFGVEKMLPGVYFGGAVWVNPQMPNEVVAQAIREALQSLPPMDARLDKAAQRYRNQVRVLTRMPGRVAKALRASWERKGTFEPAVSVQERQGQCNHDPSSPSTWVALQALDALDDLERIYLVCRECVSGYMSAVREGHLDGLFVPGAALSTDAQPLLRFPVFVQDEAQARSIAEAVAGLGYYVPDWPRPLLVPGVLDPVPYGLEDGTEAWPVSQRLSAGIVALPTDIDSSRVADVVKAVRSVLKGTSQTKADKAATDQLTEGEPIMTAPELLANIRDEADVARLLQPVVCGADILGYSYVRAYHEAYGICPIVLSAIDVKVTSSSRFCDYRIVPELNDEEGFVAAVSAVGKELAAAGKVGILHGSADWNTRVISAHKEEFSQWYVVPYIDFDLLDSITQKERFYELCRDLGIPYPKTWYVDCSDPAFSINVREYPYPLIAKPSNSAAYDLLSFEGKEKIYEIQTPDELQRVMDTVRASGYTHKFILQDFVPGGDDAIRSLTTFSDEHGDLRVVSGGRVVLQDHSPLALGNPVCILGEKVDRIVRDAATFLRHTRYHGYANFDIKYDSRDDSYRFFEVNTRPGKNTYYVSLGGVNFVRPIVEDWVLHREVTYAEAYDPFLYTVVPPKVVRMSVTDQDLRDQALGMFRSKLAHTPHDYAPDSPAHKLWAQVAYRHQVSKFKKYL